jgi:hypothetical protein
LGVPNAVITLARFSLAEDGRSRTRQNTIQCRRETKGLSSLFGHYFIHRSRNSPFRIRNKGHWKIFFSFFVLQRGNFGNKKVKGEIHKMGKGLKRKHAPPKTKENSKSIRMYKKGIFTECCLCLSRI